MDRREKIRFVLKGMTVFGFTLIALLLLLECLVRLSGRVVVYGYPPGLFVADAESEYRMKSDFGPAPFVKQEFTTEIATNRDGFRDRDWGPKAPGVFRILSIGDSFVWGAYGVKPEGTYSALLEKELNATERGRRYEVLNMGVAGWGTDNELGFYRAAAKRYQADLVLLSFCVANDFFDNLQRGERSVVDGCLVNASAARNVTPAKAVRRFLMMHSQLYVWFERSLTQVPFIKRLLYHLALNANELLFNNVEQMQGLLSVDSERNSELAVNTARLLREFAAACRENHARLVVFIVPAKFQVDDGEAARVLKQSGVGQNDLTAPQRFLRSICAELGVPCIDALDEFRIRHREHPQYWGLNPHFNAEGNREAAMVIRRGLSSSHALSEVRFSAPHPADYQSH